MADSEEISIKPFFKADSGSFTNALKMPLLTNQPGRRPGDFCLDNAIGSVKVRRGDQSILILGGPLGTPSWAQTLTVPPSPSSGGPIIVNGDITFPLPSSIITTGTLTLVPASGVVRVNAPIGELAFSGPGTISNETGDLTLASSVAGAVNVDGSTLLFNQAATLTSTGVLTVSPTGALNLIPSSGQVNVTGGTLSFNQPAAIEIAGTLTLNPSSNTIAFPNGITMAPSLGSNFHIVTSQTGTGVSLIRGDTLAGFLLLANHQLSISTDLPTISYPSVPSGWSAAMAANSNDTVGAFTITGSLTDITFYINFAKPYTGTTKRWAVLAPIHGQAEDPNNLNAIWPLNPDDTKLEITGNIGLGDTIAYSYFVIGVI